MKNSNGHGGELHRIILFVLFSFCSFLITHQVKGQAGVLDPTFNSSDLGFGYGDGLMNGLYSIGIQADGKILVGGSLFSFNGATINGIARINIDGTLDVGFNAGSGPNSAIYSLTTQNDGKILIVGLFTTINGVARNRVARLNADGSLDTGFAPTGGANGTIYSVAVQPDGKIIIALILRTASTRHLFNFSRKMRSRLWDCVKFPYGTNPTIWTLTNSIAGGPRPANIFMRLINMSDQKQLVEQWIKWVSYWTKNLTCPEGISYYIETDEPEFDRWTSQKGTWQGYSMRGWYQAALHGVVGVGTDAGGITFYPYGGEEMKLSGLNYRNKKFDIEMKGSGPFIESIEAEGITIKGTCKLPAELYKNKQRLKITVNRVAVDPYPISVKTGTAIELLEYSYKNGTISAKIAGAGLCRLKLNASRQPIVKLAGKKIPVAYDPVQHTAQVELNLKPGDIKKIEIN